jgi:hypothetical protein
MRTVVDHIVWGAPDLEAGMATAERLFGQTPAPGGAHPGLGTRNALLGLADGRYLEILAPDPAQAITGTLGEKLADLSQPALVTWAVASPALGAIKRRLEAAGLETRGPVGVQRTTPAGEVLAWDLLFAGGHGFGTLFPFFIDWGATAHPSRDLAAVGVLEALKLESPHARELRKLLGNVDVPMIVTGTMEPAMRVTIETARGPVVLETVPATLSLRFG